MFSNKEINKDFCDVMYSQYLQDNWGINPGFNTVSSVVAITRKKLQSWQQKVDCSNSLMNNASTVSVIQYGTVNTDPCDILNPVMSAYGIHHNHFFNTEYLRIPAFFR